MYDFRVSEDLGQCVSFAKELGWKGFCYVMPCADFGNEVASVRKQKSIDVCSGVLIESDKYEEVRKLVDRFRPGAEMIFVRGGDTELNRYIFNMPKIDVVTGVSCGNNLDYVMCKMAARNEIAIEFSFSDLLHSYSRTRTEILANMSRNAELARKYKAPFVITSGALSKWDLRSPHDLMVFGKAIGFQEPEIKAALSDEKLRGNRKMLSGKRVAKGVEVLK
jgi:ribonuclease P/MRP protein subunit RPP1